MSLKAKSIVIFSCLLLLTFILAAYVGHTYYQAKNKSESLDRKTEKIIYLAFTTQVNFKKQVQEWKNILIRGTELSLYDKYLKQFIQAEKATRDNAINLYSTLPPNHEAENDIKSFIATHKKIGARYREALTAYKVAEYDPHITVDKYVRGIDRAPTALLSKIINLITSHQLAKRTELKSQIEQTEKRIIIFILVGTILSGLFLMVTLYQIFLLPIKKFSNAIQHIANGNYNHRIMLKGKDEFSHMAHMFNDMSRELKSSHASMGKNLIQQKQLVNKLNVANDALEQNEVHIQGILDNVNDAIITMNVQGEIFSYNLAVKNMFNYEDSDFDTLCFTNLLTDTYKNSYETYIKEYLSTGDTAVLNNGIREIEGSRKDGETFPIELSINDMKLNNKQLFVGVIRDISIRKQQQQQLKYIENHDILTGLPNRNLLKDRLKQSIRHSRRESWLMAVLFIDLDGFKRINDTLGHDVGDTLINMAASRLKLCVRKGDTVARLGGDKFILILENVSHVDVIATIANKIITSMNESFTLDNRDVFVTASIGITVYPDDANTIDDLLSYAEVSMYRAKTLGRNRFQYYATDINEFALERLELESKLHRALENEEFILYYQPQVDLTTGKISGVEALLRWQNPEQGLIAPYKFLPLLEETGLILPVGEQILEMACAQTRKWVEQGFTDIRTSINLSARQFEDPDLVDKIVKILLSQNVLSSNIELEVTESAIMADANTSREKLNALDALGISIAIDDFGTGYSSLAYLKQFPVDTLKIDRSFVMELEKHTDDQAIATAIISLARALNLQVVAEGVENREQLSILIGLNCDIMQGYYFSKPLPAEEITILLKNDRQLELPDVQPAIKKFKTH